jgi:diacylglycerol kinase (ATP)
MKYWIKRLSHPFRGLRYAFTRDFAVRFETIVFGIIGIPAVYFLFGPLSAWELLLLIFCWFFIVVTEIQNTAIEIALTKLHPEHDEAIGRSKDLSSGAVVWAFVFGLISLALILSGRL